MSELDVIRLHTGLQLDYGSHAAYVSDVSSTISTSLLSPNGLPLNVGWFDNSKKSLRGDNVYALTAHPNAPRNMHHRIILQQGAPDSVAALMKEDSAGYLEGYDDYPRIYRHGKLGQPEIDKTIRAFSIGAYVLDATAGESHAKFAWANAYDVSAVQDHGLNIISAGDDILAVIDDAALNRYAEIDPPVLP